MSDFYERFARLCLAREPSETDLAALGGDARWAVYRRLLRARVTENLLAAFPALERHLGADALRSLVADFLEARGPSSRYARGIPGDFADYLAGREETAEGVPRDLALYERALLDLVFAEDPREEGLLDFAMELPAALTPAFRLLSLSSAVDLAPVEGAYAEGPRLLCVYRSPADYEVLTLALSPFSFELLLALEAGTPPAEGVPRAAARCGLELTAGLVGDVASLLADLLERGVLLGSRAR